MKKQWHWLSSTFDARPVRERLLIAAGILLALWYGFAVLAFMPARAQRDRLAVEVAALQGQVKTLDAALQDAARTASPAAQLAYRDALRAQIKAMDTKMRGMQRTLVAPDEMPGLLRNVLAPHRRLTLLSLHNLPVQPLDSPRLAGAPQPGAAPPRLIYRHTVEIRVAGSYAELHAYLAQLESMPLQMYWGRLEVEVKAYPALVATLTVHTLSLDKAWLAV